MRGEWNARACVVLLGMVVPAFVCMASAIASKSRTLIANLLKEMCVVKTDSATLLVGMSRQNFAVTERPGCKVRRPVVRQKPREHLKSRQACDPDASGPLCWLDVAVELMPMKGI